MTQGAAARRWPRGATIGVLVAILAAGCAAGTPQDAVGTAASVAASSPLASERGRAASSAAPSPSEGLPAVGAGVGAAGAGGWHGAAGAVVPGVDCSRKAARCVALTFDDGPGPYTDRLLATLRAASVPATFFMVGTSVRRFPAQARHVARAGMEICAHSWSHRDLTRLTPAGVAADFRRVSTVIRRATGVAVDCERPPYGAFDKTVLAKTNAALILWTVDTLDWKYRDAARIARIASRAHPGDVILLHDIHPKSVAAVGAIIDRLRARGFTFVTVAQMASRTGTLIPHVDYF